MGNWMGHQLLWMVYLQYLNWRLVEILVLFKHAIRSEICSLSFCCPTSHFFCDISDLSGIENKWRGTSTWAVKIHGSLNVPTFHITQPLGINGLLDGYYKVMSNIPILWDSDTNPWNMTSKTSTAWWKVMAAGSFLQSSAESSCHRFIRRSIYGEPTSAGALQDDINHSELVRW